MNTELDRNINHRLAIISSLAKRLIFRVISESGLSITPDQWSLLYYLWKKDGLTIGEIAQYSKKDFANVTRIVDKLLRDGYVKKEKDMSDKRSWRVFILPQAIEIKETVQKMQHETMQQSLAGISSTEQEFLLDILTRMESNITEQLEKK